MKALAFVGTRADLFPMAPVLRELESREDIDLHVVTAVGFEEGAAEGLLREAGLLHGRHTHHDLDLFLTDSAPSTQTAIGAELALAFSRLLESERPDAVVVLGDRWELLYVVPAVVLYEARLVHLHGGEVTEGALDERIRHAVTKLADQHCVSTEGAMRRVAQMGESLRRIHHTGAPGLDRFRDVEALSSSEFEELFGVPLLRPLILATYHPVTAGASAPPGVLAQRVFDCALGKAGTLILTHPGFDSGREQILAVLADLEARRLPGVIIRPSLGALYPRVMATADLMVGNSSSGILEAASFGLPVVDVGDRQKGRERAANVFHSIEETDDLDSAIGTALEEGLNGRNRRIRNPYGDGHAAGRIADVVAEATDAPLQKAFVDAYVDDGTSVEGKFHHEP